MYKAITKVIVHRIKLYLPDWVSSNQTSFISSRSISDNIIVVQENFIDDTLQDADFSDLIRCLILSCVSYVSSQILWNDSMTQGFKPTRGIQQGDPISPYLFVLSMEKLSQAIQGEVDVSMEQLEVVLEALDNFYIASGLKLSIAKTIVYFFNNVSLCDQNLISGTLGFKEVSELGNYLGIPIIHKMLTILAYSFLTQKVHDKLSGWYAKNLILMGRIVLTKSVLVAMAESEFSYSGLNFRSC
ncbi:hypothetical protein GQ457_03G029930 [Hibiscus cannabinus]